ncbi:cation/H(+) antiporter [Nonomuraea turkmeniaca]|uniref:Cation/H(+) antiporter n=2 Tax=Nonomuraea turkmeniaca TaxID=103838 RepID=A0A5S4FUM1_9ACTN|nr:cation/H(+) antiporter [Nonomuraea turkmeniaca]
MLARRLGQPAVLGEITAGILLGPTFFGTTVVEWLFPADTRQQLTAFAAVGVAIFMLTVGTEIDPALLRGRHRTVGLITVSSVVLPFGLGAALALYLWRAESAPPLGYVLFMGVAMSITAFPVLARIVSDHGRLTTRLGNIAITSAALIDALAWVLLATVLAVAGGAGQDPWRLAAFLPFVVLTFTVVPFIARKTKAWEESQAGDVGVLAAVCCGLLLAGAATEWMGLHYIFGAFVFGVALARTGAGSSRFPQTVRGLTELNSALLLPVFFLVAGLQVDLSQLDGLTIVDVLVVVVLAVAGKFLAAYGAARVSGLDARQSAVIGILMNTRGLTELLVLGVGREAGLISPAIYSLMVVMAVLTTAMAGPSLRILSPANSPADVWLARKP